MNTARNYFNWFRGSIRGFDTPHRLALGFTLGMMLGLLPKDSLLFYGLGLLSILSTGNLACLACGAILFHFLGHAMDPQLHQLGLAALTYPAMESTWTQLSEVSWMGWTRFNNSIVMGGVVAGLVLAFPIYLMSRLLFARFGTRLHAWFSSSNFSRWLIGPPNTLTEN